MIRALSISHGITQKAREEYLTRYASHGLYNLIDVETVPEARSLLKKSESFDLIVFYSQTILLRKSNVLKSVLQLAGGLPLIVLSRKTQPELVAHLLAEGVQDCLDVDSLSPDLLSHSMYYAIARRTYINSIESERSKIRKLRQRATLLRRERTHLTELNQAKDDFLSLASHQLRTPATGVKQYINMVLQGYMGDISAQQRTMLELANDSNERQLKVVKGLLDIARIDAGRTVLNCKETDLKQLVESVVAEQQTQIIHRRQTGDLIVDGSRHIAKIDADKFRMAIENIIDNASKYTKDGRTIHITIQRLAKYIKIKVQDEGVGIEGKDLAAVFDKFARITNPLSDDVGGSGLGLYWAKRVVELHKGSIEVTSKRNIGSTFTISLPAGRV